MTQAIVLGIVQGLTEFLPVSSSGHLVVVPYLFAWDPPPLAFDVALHAGTLLAVIAYFSGDIWFLATRSLGAGPEEETSGARRTVALLAVASAPAVLVGFFLEETLEKTFSSPTLVAVLLMVTAAMLIGAEQLQLRRARAEAGGDHTAVRSLSISLGRDETTVGWVDALTLGAAQAFAILPGISRSGATISTGMARGLSREGATRFSFLMAVPVVVGASAAKASELAAATTSTTGPYTGAALIAGVVAASVSGFWAIRFLLRLVAREDLRGFARYAGLLGILTLIGRAWLGPPSTI